MPLSAFLANLYLTKIDVWFQENDVLYARYSDDIIIFAQEEKKIEQYSERLTEMIHEAGLVLNEKKTRKTNPKEAWTFLGFQCNGNCIDVSDEALDKIKKKLKRKSLIGNDQFMLKLHAPSPFPAVRSGPGASYFRKKPPGSAEITFRS